MSADTRTDEKNESGELDDSIIEDTQPENYFENFEPGADEVAPEEILDLPAFPFDQPRTVRLKNGTEHIFSIPTLNQEKRKEGIQRTIIITSPAIINGQNPRKINTDYSKSRIAYYQDIIRSVKGYALNPGDDPNEVLDAKKVIREEAIPGKDQPRKIYLSSMIPITHQRAAVERLYGGKIEVIKPELKDGEKEVVVLNTRRFIEVKQELGIEQNDDGTFSPAEFRLKYRFTEPGSGHLSKWETNCFDGFTINNPKGGTKEERTYNVDACVKLFDSMIDSIEGGSIGGVEVDVKNSDHLAAIPEAIKTQIIAVVMHDVTTNSGN